MRLQELSYAMQPFVAKPPPLIAASDGAIRVARTRVSLETIVAAFDAGATAEEMVQQYPSVSLGSMYAAIAYILENRATVDAYVAARRRSANALQADAEAQTPPHGLRDRLLARRGSPLPLT